MRAKNTLKDNKEITPRKTESDDNGAILKCLKCGKNIGLLGNYGDSDSELCFECSEFGRKNRSNNVTTKIANISNWIKVLLALSAISIGAILLLSGKFYGIICIAASISYIPRLDIRIYGNLGIRLWVIRLLSALAVIASLSYAVINEFKGYFEWSSKLEGIPTDSVFKKQNGEK